MCARSGDSVSFGKLCGCIAFNSRQDLVAKESSAFPHSETLAERGVSDGRFLNRHGKMFV